MAKKFTPSSTKPIATSSSGALGSRSGSPVLLKH